MCIYISPSLHTTTTTTKHNPLPSGGPDAEMVGGLSAGSGNRGPPGGRAIEELEIDEGTTPPPRASWCTAGATTTRYGEGGRC